MPVWNSDDLETIEDYPLGMQDSNADSPKRIFVVCRTTELLMIAANIKNAMGR